MNRTRRRRRKKKKKSYFDDKIDFRRFHVSLHIVIGFIISLVLQYYYYNIQFNLFLSIVTSHHFNHRLSFPFNCKTKKWNFPKNQFRSFFPSKFWPFTFLPSSHLIEFGNLIKLIYENILIVLFGLEQFKCFNHETILDNMLIDALREWKVWKNDSYSISSFFPSMTMISILKIECKAWLFRLSYK